MKEDTAKENSIEDLQALCARIIKGEPISDHHADEQMATATILPAMCERACCAFPLTIVHRDKPDFILRSDHSSIDLKVTRFLASSRAHATATARRLKTGLTPSLFDFDSPNRSREQMENVVVAPSVGLTDWKPIFDQQYVDRVIAIVGEKKQKILIDGDAPTDEDWLLIDEHHRMSDLQLDFVVKQSLLRLEEHWAKEPHFSKVLILSESVLVDLNQDDSGWRQVPRA